MCFPRGKKIIDTCLIVPLTFKEPEKENPVHLIPSQSDGYE